MQPTLLVGPSDWDDGRMPRAEFLARTAALWRNAPAAAGAIVFGDRAQHGELAYLTHFTPKLEAALALIPRVGAPQLLVGGGANMLPAAKPLTFVENLRPLRDAGRTVAQWTREQSGGGRPVLIGGTFMSYALRREIDAATGPIADKTTELRALMRRKSARELNHIRVACVTLGGMMDAMRETQGGGTGATATVLFGESAAHKHRAQDVRILFSLDGGRTLQPFETPVERAVDPLQVYVAVRQFGYWVEGFAVIASSPTPGVQVATAILRQAVEMVQPGRRCDEVARCIAELIGPLDPHPITAQVQGNGIGLALEERPLISATSEDTLEAGDILSLRVGVSDGRDHAIVSAMVAVHADDAEVLWSAPLPGTY